MITQRHRLRDAGHLIEEGRADPYAELTQRFHHLYTIAQDSNHVFGSPLGPFVHGKQTHYLPRFVYFGPQSSDDSVRLAFYAGFDGADPRTTSALLHLVERLALTPEVGHGLNLSFFPVVNPSGLQRASRFSAAGVDLAAENWERSTTPEIALLRQDARLRGYHGFVRIEAAPVDEIVGTIRSSGRTWSASDVELASVEANELFPLRWEADTRTQKIGEGPLTLADDFVLSPFEFILRIPAAWNMDLHREAITQVLKRFIVRYRAVFSYGIHL